MARNSEKAQSMLFRFNAAQQSEKGIITRGQRRPRMASSVTSIRECENWRGEVLRDISRKVDKIQDMGLTDYEIRDLNDEINGLLREKSHWERQLIALGGANYRRAAVQLDDSGKEVPGTRGYKYFGRAKELPGVKELFFTSEAKSREERRENRYKPFRNQGPAYYGDLDEMDGKLLQWEAQQEAEEERIARQDLEELLGRDAMVALKLSDALPSQQPKEVPKVGEKMAPSEKRRATDDADDDALKEEESKRTKATESDAPAGNSAPTTSTLAQAFPYIPATALQMMSPPSTEDMEAVLLQIRKDSLLKQYSVN